nr:helix-turn-helix transcriptional regulator [Cupriavidus taiwanensis]
MVHAYAADPFLYGLYGCCTEPRRWTGALDRLCADMEAGFAVLYGVTLAGARAVPYWVAQNSRFDMARYQSAISDAQNPRLEAHRIAEAARAGRLVSDDDAMFAPSERSACERIQHQMRSIGLGSFIGGGIEVEVGRYFTIALFRDGRDTRRFTRSQAGRLEGLLPHLAQAFTLTQSLAASRAASALVDGLLDRSACALLVCDVHGRIDRLNREALRLLDQKTGLHQAAGMLRVNNVHAQQQLAAAMARAGAEQLPVFMSLHLPAGRHQVSVQPLDAASDMAVPRVLVSVAGNEPSGGSVPVDALRALFDLTEAEARLASALVDGVTVEQYAQRRGVKVGTVRFQLNQVLVKSGAHRQADLVRRVLRSVAAHLPRPQGTVARH